MRVLRIFHGGGVAAYQRRDEELAALGHEILLVVPTKFRELPEITVAAERTDTIRVKPIRLYGLRRNPFFFYNPITIARLAKSFRPQVVDIHEEPYSLAALSILAGIRLVAVRTRFIFRSSQNEYKKYPYPFSRIQAYVFKVCYAAYVPSRQAEAVLRRKSFPKPIRVIGNGVELPATPARLTLKAEAKGNVPPTRKFIYVGRLTERKGVWDLLEAMKGLSAAHLILVGSGPLEGELTARVDGDDELKGRVDIKGPMSHAQVMMLFDEADVVCVPSRRLSGWSEQFSRALVEGMAHGCVPLVSDSGALEEVSGGVFASFPAGDRDALRKHLNTLLSMCAADFRGLSEQSRQQARKFSWEATSRTLSEIYSRGLQE